MHSEDRQADQPQIDPAQASRFVVVSGPTAVGKGTVVSRLSQEHPEVFVSVSVTTRPARPGEAEGEHYYFVDDSAFDRLVADGELLEWALVHATARYGTPREPVLQAVRAGRTAILEIDVQGARQVRRSWPGARFVFLTPPSWHELERRLVGRGTETAEQQQRRLATAREELAEESWFDHVVVNRTVEQAVRDLVDYLRL